MDRIDLHIEVPAVKFDELSDKRKGESSQEIRQRVIEARETQAQRLIEAKGVYYNAQLSTQLIEEHCQITEAGQLLLKNAMDKMGLSAF